MANENPTGSGSAVALTIPADHVAFLRGVFRMARDGIRDELENYPERLREPARLHREEAVHDALLAALVGRSIVVSDDTRQVLFELAQTIDRENEYARVVAEHAALLGLYEQIGEGASR